MVIKESFTKPGGPFWYYTRHGVQPGSVPKDINILYVLDSEDATGTYFLSDKVIDTKQLNDYEIKELSPDLGVSDDGRYKISLVYDDKSNVSYNIIDTETNSVVINNIMDYEDAIMALDKLSDSYM